MKQIKTESRTIVEIFSVMGEIIGELLAEFDDVADLSAIDYDFV